MARGLVVQSGGSVVVQDGVCDAECTAHRWGAVCRRHMPICARAGVVDAAWSSAAMMNVVSGHEMTTDFAIDADSNTSMTFSMARRLRHTRDCTPKQLTARMYTAGAHHVQHGCEQSCPVGPIFQGGHDWRPRIAVGPEARPRARCDAACMMPRCGLVATGRR